eukprot:XP_017952450.1 PREDICTED: uncharacterized protein polr1d.2 isoform X2 [Xenopus tropicalis]
MQIPFTIPSDSDSCHVIYPNSQRKHSRGNYNSHNPPLSYVTNATALVARSLDATLRRQAWLLRRRERQLWKCPDIEFCGYSITHPSETKINFRIQTRSQYQRIQRTKGCCDGVTIS